MNENLKGIISLFSSNHVTNEGTVYNRNRSYISLFTRLKIGRKESGQKSTSNFRLDPLTLSLSHNNKSYLNDKRGEGEEEHDTVEGDAHTIISCIIFSMSCVLFLIVIVFVYDVVKYTKFGRNYLTVSCILK